MIWHITPVNDTRDHKEKSTCECGPEIEKLENGDLLVIHNSYDGREYKERLIARAKNSKN